MNHKQVIQRLNELEANYPVKDWLVDDIYVWPLLKYHIFKEWKDSNELKAPTQPKSKSLINKLTGKFRKYYQIFKSGKKITAFKKAKINESPVLFTGFNAHRVDVNGLYANRYFQPIAAYLKKQFNYDSIIVEYRDRDVSKNYLDEKQIVFFTEWLPWFSHKYRSAYRNMEAKLKDYSQFEENALTDFTILKNKSVSVETLKKLVREIKIYSHVYELIIDKVNPKLIMGLCYYNKPVYGLNYAASKRGIPTIDIQHGGQGKLHVSYGDYNAVPQKGYNLMPSIFWCWDIASYNTINSWVEKQNVHRVLLGGNPWFDYFFESIKREDFKFPEQKIILYSMQLDIPEDYILEAIQNTPSEYQWWLRFHPRTTNETRTSVKEKLAQASLTDKVEIEKASTYPMPLILENTSVHISKFSGSIIEATQLGVQTILIDPVGVENYGDYISSGNAIESLSGSAEILVDQITTLGAAQQAGASDKNFKVYQQVTSQLLNHKS